MRFMERSQILVSRLEARDNHKKEKYKIINLKFLDSIKHLFF